MFSFISIGKYINNDFIGFIYVHFFFFFINSAWFYCKACHDDIKDETLIKKCKCKNCKYNPIHWFYLMKTVNFYNIRKWIDSQYSFGATVVCWGWSYILKVCQANCQRSWCNWIFRILWKGIEEKKIKHRKNVQLN